jgi:hypothetical protein
MAPAVARFAVLGMEARGDQTSDHAVLDRWRVCAAVVSAYANTSRDSYRRIHFSGRE